MAPGISFIRVDRDVLCRRDLSDKEKLLLGLVREMKSNGVGLSNGALAEVLCTTEDYVTNMLAALRSKKLVRITNAQSRYRRIYSDSENGVDGYSDPQHGVDGYSDPQHGVEAVYSDPQHGVEVGRKNSTPTHSAATPTHSAATPTVGSEYIITEGTELTEKKKSEKKKTQAGLFPDGGHRRASFKAPTVEEVRAYCADKGYGLVNAEAFVAHYESNGWRVGKNKMQNWHAAAAGWNAREAEKRGTNGSGKYRDDETRRRAAKPGNADVIITG